MRRWLAFSVALVLTSGLANPAIAAPDRRGPCSQAWMTLAQESAALESGSTDAWSRVEDAFLSLSDGTFDGPLSNAFGEVARTASDQSPAGLDAAARAMGTVCAQLTVTRHAQKVARFQRFAYETGKITGLSPKAGRVANATIALAVDRSYQAARRANGSSCFGAETTCGYFVQTLKQKRCASGFVCVLSQTGILPVGANSGEAFVTGMPFDALTGRIVPLSRVVPADTSADFLSRVNAAVSGRLVAEGLGNDDYWTPDVKLKDIRSWLPQPDGIHIWFDKYAVAPGVLGVFEVVVPR